MSSLNTLIKQCIKQLRGVDEHAFLASLTNEERRVLLDSLTEVIESFTNLRDRLHEEVPFPDSEQRHAEERFKQKLLEEGLLTEIKDVTRLPKDDWVPIKVRGKPLSEIIIEERR